MRYLVAVDASPFALARLISGQFTPVPSITHLGNQEYLIRGEVEPSASALGCSLNVVVKPNDAYFDPYTEELEPVAAYPLAVIVATPDESVFDWPNHYDALLRDLPFSFLLLDGTHIYAYRLQPGETMHVSKEINEASEMLESPPWAVIPGDSLT